MKHLIAGMLICILCSCSNESERIVDSSLNYEISQLEINKIEKDISDYLKGIESDIDLQRAYIKEAKLKPNDEEWRLKSFRKFYPELQVLIEKHNVAFANLHKSPQD